jgi:predicted ATPase/DNA-binding CsgD family transcriptional regulator
VADLVDTRRVGVLVRVPAELSSFVGRAAELAEIGGRLRAGRALTLSGPGGAGKTRLAIRTCRLRAGDWPDGVYWAALESVTCDGDVAPALAAVLGVVAPAEGDVAHAIAGRLAARRALLVLDNCEHVLDGAARLVESVLAQCPGVAVLATSRSALGVPAERRWIVPPLVLSDALALFGDRSGVDAPGEPAAAVRRICDRLDRVPLALELAAGWVGTLTLAQIADALVDPLGLPGQGARTAPFRQRTLEESMRWSHDLLDERERVLFRRLGAYEAGFDAGAVAGGPAATLALRGLVEKSLLVVDASGPVARYRMLATVRSYARARLVDSGELDQTRDEHLEVYAARVRQAAGLLDTDKDRWRELVRGDYANLRTAIEWGLGRADPAAGRELAARLAWLWHLEGIGRDGLELLDRAVRLGRGERTELQARCLLGYALVADTALRSGPGHSAAAEARQIADEVGAPGTARLARSLTIVGLLGSDLDGARAEAVRLRAEAEPAADGFVTDACDALIGLVHVLRDEHRAAIEVLTPAIGRLLARGDRGIASSGLCWLATSVARSGDLPRATELATRAIAEAEPLRDFHRIGLARGTLAEIHLLRGLRAEARTDLAPIAELVDGLAEPPYIPGWEGVNARLCLADGDPEAAIRWCTRDDRALAPATRVTLARSQLAAGDTGAARRTADALAAEPWLAAMPAVHAATVELAALLDGGVDGHHEALRIRYAHGLLLDCVDSLEQIAARRPDPILQNAVSRARDRLDPAELGETIGYAQRSRGRRNRATSGLGSLTPTELAVAELAAQGLSNPEIGAKLFISRATVKTHLAHAYAKLHVTGRVELTRSLLS